MIWTFFSFNALLFYVLAIAPIVSFKDFDWQAFLAGRGVWLLVIPVILFILNGILSSNQKATITFWRIKNPLPACRSFSVYARIDDRVDFKKLEKNYNPLPETAKEQNSLWYSIYKDYQEEPLVKKSHKDFLLGRDMCTIALLFLVFGGVLGIFLIADITKWWYLIYTFFQYIILAIVTQNHGKRFVCNVLALETSKKS
tara:strand:- start:9837 stop:10433 length:597 start_codon:yes stop_codon:yes gene_type:complete